MDLRILFKWLVLSEFALNVLVIITTFYESNAVAAFNEGLGIEIPLEFLLPAKIVMVAMVLLYIVSIGLLLFFVNVGRWIFLFCSIASFFYVALIGPTAADPMRSVIENLALAVMGAIVTFTFFTPIREQFSKHR